MKFPFQDLTLISLLVAFVVLPSLVSCEEEKAEKKPEKKVSGKVAKVLEEKQGDPSAEVEAFTGAHTRVVWSEYSEVGEGDAFATSDGLFLKGLDTQDGKGERFILQRPGNYSRPLLTCDGTGILFTDKNTVRKGGKKHYHPLIYRTDWKGDKPIRLAEGYAVDCWLDPKTGTEYIYAVQNLKSSKGLALEGDRLVRFPLHDPAKLEVVYDNTHITPDNVQFSRDGTRASGLFPWPHAGILRLIDGKWTAKKLNVGCWTSLAPDNSGVSWSFDGEHKSVAMYADDGGKAWNVKFNTVPDANGRELYHPRWTNHARFITVTGPYTKKKGHDGSVINKGGGSAEIFLGKLSETADKIEAWVRVTHDKRGESYPDAWIEGGEKADLKGFTIPKGLDTSATLAASWPANRTGLLFLWQDRSALNDFVSRDGGKRESMVEGRGAARSGRFNEMVLDGGKFEAEADSATLVVEHLQKKIDVTFEAIIIPPGVEESGRSDSDGHIFSSPSFVVAVKEGKLAVADASGNAWQAATAVPQKSFHLVVKHQPAEASQPFIAFVEGEVIPLTATAALKLPVSTTLAFGGGWNGGLLNIALYDRLFTDEDIIANAEAARTRIASFPPAPTRVKLMGRLVEVSALPTPEGIAPYTGSLVAYVYEVEKVLSGEFTAPKVLVKHWCMLDQKVAEGFPREVGKSYELTLEREADHAHLKGERVMDDTTAFDLEAWFDVAPPRVKEDSPPASN